MAKIELSAAKQTFFRGTSFFDEVSRYSNQMLPEQELWFEVIYLALQDFAGTTRESRVRVHCQRAAQNWFFSSDRGVGSFLFCCEALDLDPGAVRRALRNVDPESLRKNAAIRANFIDRPFTDALDNPKFDCFPGLRLSPEIFR